MSKRFSLPCWILAASAAGFISTWLLAPVESISGSHESTPFFRSFRVKPAPAHALHLQLGSEDTKAASFENQFIMSRPWQVTLTFDDGPHHLHTRRLLSILESFGVKATFFINGCWLSPNYPHGKTNREILLQAFRQGHTIGNHTLSHPNLGQLGKEDQTHELFANEAIIRKITGVQPTFFRAPYAVTTRHTRALLAQHGYIETRWNSAAPDEENVDPEAVRNTVMKWLRHHQGGIVMLHDRNRWAVEATALLLQTLQHENCRRLVSGQPLFQVVPLDSFLVSPTQSPPLRDPEEEVRERFLQATRTMCGHGGLRSVIAAKTM